MREALASACRGIGPDTPLVREVLRAGVNGRRVSFFDLPGIADRREASSAPAANPVTNRYPSATAFR
jgi:hypothetical protein